MLRCSGVINLKIAYNIHRFSLSFHSSKSTISVIISNMLVEFYCLLSFLYSCAVMFPLFLLANDIKLQLDTYKLTKLQRHLTRPKKKKKSYHFFLYFRIFFYFFFTLPFTVFRFQIPRLLSSYSDIKTHMNSLRCSIT